MPGTSGFSRVHSNLQLGRFRNGRYIYATLFCIASNCAPRETKANSGAASIMALLTSPKTTSTSILDVQIEIIEMCNRVTRLFIAALWTNFDLSVYPTPRVWISRGFIISRMKILNPDGLKLLIESVRPVLGEGRERIIYFEIRKRKTKRKTKRRLATMVQ